jgi:GR25 family glycosyltransferase involved in LPS biosynthesis
MKIDHVYCINLERSKERRRHMETQFEKLDIDVEFFKACDGKAMGKDGAWGCASSHLGVWRDIVAKGYKNSFILEDDVTLSSDIQKHLEEIEEPYKWDIIYLFTFGPIHGPRHDSMLFTGKSLSMAGYIISNRCAKRLHLLEPDDMGCAIDEFIAAKLNLRTFIVHEKLITGNLNLQLQSTIGINLFRVLNGSALSHWFEYFHGLEIMFVLLIFVLLARLQR